MYNYQIFLDSSDMIRETSGEEFVRFAIIQIIINLISLFEITSNLNSFIQFTNFETRWSNPKFSKQEIDKMWTVQDSLMTVGSKGVASTHINSLIELLSQHHTVRIKIANDKMNSMEISKQFADNEEVKKVGGELIEVRKRGFMFIGRKGKN